MVLYSQRDPRWAGHVLGWGPALGTIGAYGCFDTVLAMIANDAGHTCDPASLDATFTTDRIFVRESTSTYDLLPDNALDVAYPGRFQTTHFPGYRADLIAAAVPTHDTYVILWISTPSVPTHFVLAYSASGYFIADPWTGRVGTLAGYGGPGAVHKTTLVKALPAPVVAPAPAPAGAPVPVPTPPPPSSIVAHDGANAPGFSDPPPNGGSPVTNDPTPAPVAPPDVPEPPVVAEQGVTTSEWKLAVAYLAQAFAAVTLDAVNAVAASVFHTSVTVPPAVLDLAVKFEFVGAAVVASYVISRGVRKLGAK